MSSHALWQKAPEGVPGWAGFLDGHPMLCTPPTEHHLSEEPEPYLAAYLHTVPQPNEHNCSARRRVSLEVLQGADHRAYTFFIAPG